MNKNTKESIFGLIVLLIIAFYSGGFKLVWEIIRNILMVFTASLGWFNQISVALTGDTILSLLFSSTIKFVIVGILFSIFNIQKGTML